MFSLITSLKMRHQHKNTAAIILLVLSILFLAYPGTFMTGETEDLFAVKIMPVIYQEHYLKGEVRQIKGNIVFCKHEKIPFAPKWALVFCFSGSK
ncbi:MAG: hypothetical protein ABH869_01045 [Candidatus Omnitrophota bacterium]